MIYRRWSCDCCIVEYGSPFYILGIRTKFCPKHNILNLPSIKMIPVPKLVFNVSVAQ